jgi:hypothetical protein
MTAPRDTPDKALRKAAYAATQSALASGLLTRAKFCAHCGKSDEVGRIVGHHRDYAHPLLITWVCTFCHQMEHAVSADWGGVSGSLDVDRCVRAAKHTGRHKLGQICRAIFGSFGREERRITRDAMRRERKQDALWDLSAQEAAE